MATTSSSSPTPPADTRDYQNPGIFVGTWPNVMIIEDMGPAPQPQTVIGQIPWDILASIKMTSPELSEGIIICGWDGVREILERLELAMLQVGR